MSEQFQPGDMVECVDDTPRPGRRLPAALPVRGELYTVIATANRGQRGSYVFLAEHPNPVDRHYVNARMGDDWGWLAVRFRRVYRPSADLIAKLTAEPVLPDAPQPKEKARTEARTSEPATTPAESTR